VATGSGRRGPGTDLVAGLVAAVAFLVMVFPLAVNLWLSIALAGLVYAGARLGLTRGEAPAPRALDSRELIRQIGQLCAAIPSAKVRERVAETLRQASGILSYLDAHPDKGTVWRGIVCDSLESTRRVVQRYVELSRFVDDPRHSSLAAVEDLLDHVAHTFSGLRARLVDEDAADLSDEMEVFRSTLKALDEVTLVNRAGGNP